MEVPRSGHWLLLKKGSAVHCRIVCKPGAYSLTSAPPDADTQASATPAGGHAPEQGGQGVGHKQRRNWDCALEALIAR